MADNTDRYTAPDAEEDDPLGPEHQCSDYDDDCHHIERWPSGLTHTRCWAMDPTCGWCPFLKEAARDE